MKYDLQSKSKKEIQAITTLNGVNFMTTTNEVIDLANNNGMHTVLIFSSEFCYTCDQELKKIQSYLGGVSATPTKINLYTIALAMNQAQASAWAQIKNISWKVGVDEQTNLFKKFCPQNLTPCIVVSSPKKVELVKQALTPISVLTALTGEWI